MWSIIVVLVQKPMAQGLLILVGSSTVEELKSQIVLGLPFLNAWKHGKLKNVGKATHGRFVIVLTTTKGG